MFVRDGGEAHALPTAVRTAASRSRSGKQEFPGTFTCGITAWMFDVRTGELVAPSRDARTRPICGKGAGAPLSQLPASPGIVWITTARTRAAGRGADIPREIACGQRGDRGRIVTRDPVIGATAPKRASTRVHGKYLHRDAGWCSSGNSRRSSPRSSDLTNESVDYAQNEDRGTFGDFPGLAPAEKKRFVEARERQNDRLGASPARYAYTTAPGSTSSGTSPTVVGQHRYLQFVGGSTLRLSATVLSAPSYLWLFLRWIFTCNQQSGRTSRAGHEDAAGAALSPDH